MDLYTFIVLWLVGAAIVAAIAGHYGRERLTWFLGSALLSPAIGLILVLVKGPQKPSPEGEPPKGRRSSPTGW